MRIFVRDRLHAGNNDLPYYITIAIAAALFIAALNGFAELTDELAENDLTQFDDVVSTHIVSLRSDGLTSFLIFVTHLGDKTAYIIIAILMAVYSYIKKHRWKFILQTTLVLLLSTAANVVLKRIINRPRPDWERLIAVDTLSYPSGHSMSAMAFYGFLIYLCVRYEMTMWVRIVTVTSLALLILLIGVSRIYLGVHFPSDVVAGYIGGLIWVTFCAIVFNTVELWQKKKTEGR